MAAEGPDPHNPFALGAELAGDLARLGEAARRAGSRFRPEVVRYLFGEGWRPLHARFGDSERGRRALRLLWSLQLESVLAGTFGVSGPGWRGHAAYPDRYFPRLWLDTLPRLAARLDPEACARLAVRLFNLGERLLPVSRVVANRVAEALYEAAEAADEDALYRALRRTLRRVGVLAEAPVGPRHWRALTPLDPLPLGQRDPAFLVDGLLVAEDDTLVAIDSRRGLAAHILATEVGLELAGLAADDRVAPLPTRVALDGAALCLEGRRLVLEVDDQRHPLGELPLLFPRGFIVTSAGVVAAVDAFSQDLAAYRLEA